MTERTWLPFTRRTVRKPAHTQTNSQSGEWTTGRSLPQRQGHRLIAFINITVSLRTGFLKREVKRETNYASTHVEYFVLHCSTKQYNFGVIWLGLSAYRKPAFQPSAFRRLFVGFQPSAENQPISKFFYQSEIIFA